MNSQLIKMEANADGYMEGIGLDTMGYVSEGGGENIFMVKNGKLYTPSTGSSILPGITRHSIIVLARELGYSVTARSIPREAFYIADEVFFTGSAAEVTPIAQIDRIEIGNGSRGPITKALQDAFFGITSGEQEDRHGWLTMV
jgi:branched-chain amino acid aminotransferase